MTPEEFNKHNPVGGRVVYRDSFGGELQTVTQSEAFQTANGYQVILLQGVSGYALLCRVEPDPHPFPFADAARRELIERG